MDVRDKVKGFHLMKQTIIGIKKIPIKKIDNETLREDIYPDRVESIKKGLREGTFKSKEKPIDAFKVRENYYIANGHHRVTAFKELGKKFIFARVFECSLDKRRKISTYQ